MRNYLKKISYVITCIVYLQASFIVFSPNKVLAKCTKEQRKIAIAQNKPFFCEDDSTSCTTAPGSGDVRPGPLYLLGDSIGTQINAPLTSALSGKGWTVRANVYSGRNLKGSPPSPDGLTAIDNDAEFIKTTSVIVIELGTNTGGLNAQNIATAIDKIRGLSPNAKIFWVDTAVVERQDYAKALSTVNAAINSSAAAKGYTVISWNKKVFGASADPQNINPSASDNGFIRHTDEKVHLTDSGIQAMTDLISSSLGGPSVTSSIGTSSCVCDAGGSGGPSDFSGSDNEQITFNFFVSKGLTKAQAAGIVGNAVAESSMNPKSLGKSYSGLFQWDNGGRFENLKKWTASKGLDYLSIQGQLEFAWYEAGERGNIAGMRQQNQPDLAAWYWGRFFEVAIINRSTSTVPLTNVQALQKRIDNANRVFAKFSGETTANSGNSAGGGCSGQNSQFVDGFTVYSQYDASWKNKPYSTSTIGVSGCGPSAMAMIITALTKQQVTPVDTATYAASKGMYIAGAGSSWSIGPVLAEHWGLRTEPVGSNIAKITQALQSGGLIITAGKGPKPFTNGGHFIVIRAVTASGKFLVGDSGHNDTSTKEWEPQQILSSMSGGSAYAVYAK